MKKLTAFISGFILMLNVIIVILPLGGCAAVHKGMPEEYSDTRFMFDTVCTICADGNDPKSAVETAFEKIADIEKQVSYFSDTSDVAAVNRAAAGENVPLGEDAFEILKTALDVSIASGGAFDVTVAPLNDLWNFKGGDHEPPTDAEIAKTMENIGFDKLMLDKDKRTVTKTADGVRIDLGGAAKGYAADAAAEELRRGGAGCAVIDLGGNIRIIGKNPKRDSADWVIGIQKPFADNGEYSQTVTIDDGTVVTSGVYQRYFTWDGVMYHHILNPETGRPAESGLSGASIVSDSSLLADCLSTACMVLGEEKGRELAENFGARLVVEY